MSIALNINLIDSELEHIAMFDTPDEELSEQARTMFDEFQAAMSESGQKFTRLAYKQGESAIRRMLASHDFTLWEDYLDALNSLGSAGKAVRTLAISVARYVCGGRIVNPRGGYYFRPTATFLQSETMDGITIWSFAPFADNAKIEEALGFARENKGKLFTLQLTREPVKRGPLDALLETSLKLEIAKSRKSSEDKKEQARAKKIENALAELATETGIELAQLKGALATLAAAKARLLKKQIEKAKAAAAKAAA